MIVYKNGSVLINGELKRLDIAANHGRIIELAPDIVADNEAEVKDCTGKYILPALVDIHTHGANGYDFNTADIDGMKKILDFYIAHGVGTVFPTVMTDSEETICHQLELIAKLAKEYPEIKGVNLEGPFLSKEFCGAMPVEYLCKPSVELFDKFQKSADNLIRLVTVAPELDGAVEFVKAMKERKVVVSLGHSGANHRQTMDALENGAKSFTHWGNAMKKGDQHNTEIAGTALLSNAYCEMICDGKHIGEDVMQLVLKTKGIDKVIGITDSMMAAGLSDGQYKLGVNDVTVTGLDAMITGTNVRAGSVLTADTGLANVIKFTGLPLKDAIKLWTVNPAKLVKLDDRIGTIEVGKDADFIIMG